MTTKIDSAIRIVTADKVLSSEEWKNSLAPTAEATSVEGSGTARAVLGLYADDSVTIDSFTRGDMRRYLEARGYDVPAWRPAGMSSEELVGNAIAGNVSEVDQTFQSLASRAGRAHTPVTIAVLDGSFDTRHAALDTKLWRNHGELEGDEIDNDGNGLADDVRGWDFNGGDANANIESGDPEWQGHGAHVMGIATGGTNNVNAMALRISGTDTAIDPVATAKAIDYAAAQGARVVNMSIKVDTAEAVKLVSEAIARHPEVLFVKSAGNDGRALESYEKESYLPLQDLPNLAIISSADPDGSRADYSNYGAPHSTHAAVGSEVLATVPGGGFGRKDGTSMAAPNVTNMAAKLVILDPGLSPEQLKGMLTDATDKVESWDSLTAAGGIVNRHRAYQLAALTGLMRRGETVEAAAARLGLNPAEQSALLAVAQKYV